MKLFSIFLSTCSLLLSIIASSYAQSLKTGAQVVSFHSTADDTDQPYALYLPKDFDSNKIYPLVIMLHGAGSNHRLALRRVFGKSNFPDENDVEASRYFPEWKDVDYIVAAPYARGTAGYQGIPEKDVYDALEDVKNRFNIDKNRIYLTGLSMGGGGTLWIGLTRPDIWAAIAPVCPAPPMAVRELLGNALNFPVHFFHGDADPVVPVQWSRDFNEQMNKLGVDAKLVEYPNILHDSWVQAYEDGRIFDWFDNFKRIEFPTEINFSTHSLKYNKSYWIEIHQINQEKVTKLNAIFKNKNEITITTNGITSFAIHPENHPNYNSQEKINLKIDDQTVKVFSSMPLKFNKVSQKWIQENEIASVPHKSSQLPGLIFDGFSDRHIYVYGTEDNPSKEILEKRRNDALKAANWSIYRGEFLGRIHFFPRVIADNEIRKSDLESSHLILFGTKETNAIIKNHAQDLPMHLTSNSEDYGLLYIYPINGKYFVISSGVPWWENSEEAGYPFVNLAHRQLADFRDYLFFKGSTKNKILDGYFDHEWKIMESEKKEIIGKKLLEIN